MSVPPRRHFVFEIISTTQRQTDKQTHRVSYGGGAHLKNKMLICPNSESEGRGGQDFHGVEYYILCYFRGKK